MTGIAGPPDPAPEASDSPGVTAPVRVPLDSDALRANLARTAQPVQIPDRYRALLVPLASHETARAACEAALVEYFHGYRSLEVAVEDTTQLVLRHWGYFERDPERAAHFERLTELLLGLLETPLSGEQRSKLARGLAGWCQAVLRGGHAASYATSIERIARALAVDVRRDGAAYLERDRMLRELVRAGAAVPALAIPMAELLRAVLDEGYRLIAERADLPGWAGRAPRELAQPAHVAIRFAALGRDAIVALRARLAAASDGELGAFELAGELLERALGELAALEPAGDRFAACLFLLASDVLGSRKKAVAQVLEDVVRELTEPARGVDVVVLLDALAAFFGARPDLDPGLRFAVYEAIGVRIGRRGAVDAAHRLTADLLAQPFQYPEIRGATTDWQTVVNPAHLPNVRCWLRIIESNPQAYEQLAAGLHVQLVFGGVFVSDTDLFQRDISRLLGADLRGSYFVVKQLLRCFPVYFSELGAEGELRAISTEVDELCQRQDPLVHFLRKQVHAESSSRLVVLGREILHYWATGEARSLAPFLPAVLLEAVAADVAWPAGPRRVLAQLVERTGKSSRELVEHLVGSLPVVMNEDLAQCEADHPRDRRRVYAIARIVQLLEEKYSVARVDYARLVGSLDGIDPWLRQRFAENYGQWRRAAERREPERVLSAARDALLGTSLSLLEAIKSAILDTRPTVASEAIYHKRHVAAGIPSMYGQYKEPRFDALRASLRLENLVTRLLEDAAVALTHQRYVNRDQLRRTAEDLRRLERALAIDGVASQPLASNLLLLEVSFDRSTFTFVQYQNVFQFIASSVGDLTRQALRSYEPAIRRILAHDDRPARARNLPPDALAEVALREVIAGAHGLQQIDRHVAQALAHISRLIHRLDGEALTRMMNYDPLCLVSWIHEPSPRTDDQLTLGSKALSVKQLAHYGLKVPEGFILTTQLFGVLPALPHRALYADTLERIRAALKRLERLSGRKLGDPTRLLTLSIRSGAAISMPGLMTTFVNIGLNEELAEAVAQRPGVGWMAWDSYRRQLQTWAMAGGVERDVFDGIMTEHKRRAGVRHKQQFTPEQMRALARAYKQCARDHGVRLIQDPFRHIVACATKVLSSWDAPSAKVYRDYMGLAEQWGTAVIVQRMVYGNRSAQSGSGVVFTSNPKEPPSGLVRLFGDYTVCSQGEDLVGGLVYPLPISEAQRVGSPTYAGIAGSLESDFPEIYQALVTSSQALVTEREHGAPQEIEFTFESPAASDLYFLQKRPVVMERGAARPLADAPTGPPLAFGMGVAGSDYRGRVAFTMAHIDALEVAHPGTPVLLIRPDTVPEDIGMILRVGGILTARGGSTSHAAVTAKRLAKVAVVDCRTLEVAGDERARLAGKELRMGDVLVIDGRTGRIWAE